MASQGQPAPEAPPPSTSAEHPKIDVFHTVLRLGKEVTQVAGLREVVLKIHEAARKGLGFDRASVWLHNPETNLFNGTFGTNTTGELVEEWDQSYAAPNWGGMLNDPSWMVYTSNFPAAEAKDRQIMQGVHEHAGVALWAGEKPLGVLCVDNVLTQRRFTDDQIAALRLFAGYAGVAIENARLLEAVQRSEQALAIERAKLRSVIDSLPDAVFMKDRQSRFILCNPQILRASGFTSEQAMLGKTDIDIHESREDAERWMAEEQALMQTGRPIVNQEEFHIVADGTLRSTLSTKVALRDQKGEIVGLLGINRDVTDLRRLDETVQVRTRELQDANAKLRKEVEERQRAEESLKYYAFHDALTNLPNRALLLDRLQQAIHVKARRPEFAFGVLFLDLDGFKDVNDTLGHEAGDALLKAAAERFGKCLRPTDTLARFGGDEFIVLLYDIKQPGDAVNVVERLHLSLAEPLTISGQSLRSSVSIGTALCIAKPRDADELLREADIAMYKAKGQKR
ncbi:MAG TPA: diguanylate cyclase [Planctomycetota bacterium]|jgi:diguanylate cyclase (GGDEF)-like protein/PAS domain S-box-containing protein